VLQRKLGPKTDEVTGEWRKLHNGELYDLYDSLNIVCLIKSRMISAGYIAVWETGEVHTGFWWENLRERDHSEDLGIDGRIILQ